jgi:uncharacterized RDD family membrane protein YckC
LSEEDDGDEVYAVLMEFDSGGGPTMVYSSSDSFACAFWHRDAKKWSVFDKGVGADLSSRLCKVAKEVAAKMPSDSGAEVEAGDLPELPSTEVIRFSIIMASGVRSVAVDKTLISESGFESLYNGFATLFGVLVGRDFDHQRHGTLGFTAGLDVDVYPLRLEKLKLPAGFSPIFSRMVAFMVDLGIIAVILGGFLYFLSPLVNKWGLLPSAVLYVLFGLSLPMLWAWMESSPDWGHATLGKRLVGIHVHGVSSPHISFPQSLARNLSKYVFGPMFFFSGYVWSLFHPYRRSWHDLLSDTVVLEGPMSLKLLDVYDEGGSVRGRIAGAEGQSEVSSKNKDSNFVDSRESELKGDNNGISPQNKLEIDISLDD